MYHSAIVGGNLPSLLKVKFVGRDPSRTLTYGMGFRDVLETDGRGRSCAHYLGMQPDLTCLRVLSSTLDGYSQGSSLLSQPSFRDDQDEEEDEEDIDDADNSVHNNTGGAVRTDGNRRVFRLLRKSGRTRSLLYNVEEETDPNPTPALPLSPVHSSVEKELVKEGWLKKKDSDGLLWHKRWIVLSSEYLVVFKSPTSLNSPSLVVPLSGGGTVLRQKDNVIEVCVPLSAQMGPGLGSQGGRKGLGLGFITGERTKKGNLTFSLLTESEKEFQEWVLPLRALLGGQGSTIRLSTYYHGIINVYYCPPVTSLRSGRVQLVHLELRELWASSRDKDGRTPLHTLTYYSHHRWSNSGNEVAGESASPFPSVQETDVAAWLIAHGCQVNAQDGQGNTPLHLLLGQVANSAGQAGAVPLLR